MPPRPGTATASTFFEDCKDAEKWLIALNKYDQALEMVALAKKKKELTVMDNYWREKFPAIVNARDPPHFTLEELSKIMAWKLLRGKFRPLQKMCDSNSPESVVSASTLALKCFEGSKSDWKGAMKALTTLRAIGEATASALLAPLVPAVCPFMSDEALEVTYGSREYTAKAYAVLQASLIAKAKDLGGSWTAESVGKVVWIISILSANGVDVNSSAPGSSKAKKEEGKGGKGEEEIDEGDSKEETNFPKKRQRKA